MLLSKQTCHEREMQNTSAKSINKPVLSVETFKFSASERMIRLHDSVAFVTK